MDKITEQKLRKIIREELEKQMLMEVPTAKQNIIDAYYKAEIYLEKIEKILKNTKHPDYKKFMGLFNGLGGFIVDFAE